MAKFSKIPGAAPSDDDEDDASETSHTHGGHFSNGQTHEHAFTMPHHHGDGAYNAGNADHMHQHAEGKITMVHEHPYNGEHEHPAPTHDGPLKLGAEP